MLRSVGIQGFKAVFEASLSIGPFALIIGRNGSGKSSSIEAIQWLRDATFLGVSAATSGEVEFTELLNRRSDTLVLDVQFQGEDQPFPVHYTLSVGTSQKPVRPIVQHERCVVGRTSARSAWI